MGLAALGQALLFWQGLPVPDASPRFRWGVLLLATVRRLAPGAVEAAHDLPNGTRGPFFVHPVR